MREELNKYRDAYLSEAKEHLDSMNKGLLELERNPGRRRLIEDIFREAHTMKSMAATMEYDQTARLCHAIEDVLDRVRSKTIGVEACVDVLFRCFDVLELSLKEVSKGEDELGTEDLVNVLRTLQTREDVEPQRDADRERPEEPALPEERIQSIAVKVERLDLLMNLAEELLISRMRLDEIKGSRHDPELTSAVDNLGRLVADVQYNVMEARMVPLGFVFNRFPRMVRDLAKEQGKEVNLVMEGADIELDRAVIDEMGELLVHLLRNAIDHGIETADERKKAGKPAEGTIRLIGRRQRGSAIVEVSDDGRGLDLEGIRKAAVERGLVPAGATERDVMDSVFLRVSTSKRVTAVSGRGFGLNIVKRKIASLGGAIRADSAPTKGTTFTIDIPLTLAIITALLVQVGVGIYAIPLANVERLVTVGQDEIKGMLNAQAVVLNGEDIPITRLDVLFDVPSESLERQPVVIVRREEAMLGLLVDGFMSAQEIVIKPLNRLLRESEYFAGSTIVGSGEVVLILDVDSLIRSKQEHIVTSDVRG